MNTIEILGSMITELGKLILRSEEKSGTVQECALKFIHSHSTAFSDAQALTQHLQSESKFEKIYCYVCGEGKSSEEPCHLPYAPGLSKSKPNTTGFLIHIFKGEQDIEPLALDQITIGPKQYYRILHSLKHDLKRLNGSISIESWLYLLQRYGKWIPAGSHLPYLSLYSYTTMKMAMAACLNESQIEQCIEKMNAASALDIKPVAFFAVKIVGIENFVSHTMTQTDLTTLKGYTYYFQMLRELMIKECLDALNLPCCNCVLQDDNRFLLLVPIESKEKLEEILRKIESFLVANYQGRVGVATTFYPVELEAFRSKNFPAVFQTIWEKVEENEQKLFADLVSQDVSKASQLFGPHDTSLYEAKSMELNKSLQNLGDELTNARWIALEPLQSGRAENAGILNQMASFFKINSIFLQKRNEKDEYSHVYRFGNTDFASPGGIGFKFADTIPYLMSEDVPTRIPYWTVIHLRVDASSAEFMEQTATSFFTRKEFLQDFFKTYLTALLREKKYRRYTYMLKMSNLEICIVCDPQVALPLLNQIYKKFRQFTEDKFTLSSKINVFNGEYPIHQAVIEESRKFSDQPSMRNRVALLDENIPWSMVESILKAQEKLATIAKLKGKRFLYPLWSISELYRIQLSRKEKEKKDSIYWRHVVNYYFNRLGITENLEKHILESDRGPVYLNLAIRWNYLMSFES